MSKGLLSNTELIDSITADCNNAVKALASGQGIVFCGLMVGIVRKLGNLKEGVLNDMKNREQTIETLKEELRNCGMEVRDMSPRTFIKQFEKDGAGDGSN